MELEISRVDFRYFVGLCSFYKDGQDHKDLFFIESASFNGNMILKGYSTTYIVKSFYYHGRIHSGDPLINMICAFFVGDGIWRAE